MKKMIRYTLLLFVGLLCWQTTTLAQEAILEELKTIAVIDQNISFGRGGVLYTELASSLLGRPEMPTIVLSFIGGLGGRDISAEEFYEIAKVTKQAVADGKAPEPRLLYTETELREVRKLQDIAKVERHELENASPIAMEDKP